MDLNATHGNHVNRLLTRTYQQKIVKEVAAISFTCEHDDDNADISF